ncbi:MAG: hypothetical protein PVG51_17975 [Desulfosarcina sp.]|jgi:hypothetical protein
MLAQIEKMKKIIKFQVGYKLESEELAAVLMGNSAAMEGRVDG